MARDVTSTQDIHVQTYGGGDRKAVALHCGLAHSGVWKGVMAALEEPIALSAIDLPGHGRSAEWDGTGDYTARCAAAGMALIDAPVDLIGHSGGAVAALQIALARPELIRSLTLIEPVLFAAARGCPEWQGHLDMMAPYKAALDRGERMLAAERFTEIWGTGAPWADLGDPSRRYLADRIHLIDAGMPALADDNFGILAEGRLEALDVPAMIIIGTDSPPIIPCIAERIAERLPDVGLAEVPGARHLLTVTHPVQVAGLIDVNLGRD